MTEPAFGPWQGLRALPMGAEAQAARGATVAAFARGLYGAIPPSPDRIAVTRAPCGQAERLEIGIGGVSVDALLWLPAGRQGPVPLIVALDFLGPFGLPGIPFPPDPRAIVCAPAHLGGEGQPLTAAMRGRTGHRWPVAAIHAAGFGLLLSCYGSWLPDAPDAARVLSDPGRGGPPAISVWAWALLRLVDVAERLPEAGRVALAGHSRLGKAALWAAANDGRVAAVFSNASGCAGAAPAAHAVGETLADLTARYPHWLLPGAALPEGMDQHHLLAAIAPRPMVLTSARDDLWADPTGSYRALVAASAAWGAAGWPEPEAMWTRGGRIVRGALCHGLRDGGHDLTADDWQVALPHLARHPGRARAP